MAAAAGAHAGLALQGPAHLAFQLESKGASGGMRTLDAQGSSQVPVAPGASWTIHYE